jgi:hypothetical protein
MLQLDLFKSTSQSVTVCAAQCNWLLSLTNIQRVCIINQWQIDSQASGCFLIPAQHVFYFLCRLWCNGETFAGQHATVSVQYTDSPNSILYILEINTPQKNTAAPISLRTLQLSTNRLLSRIQVIILYNNLLDVIYFSMCHSNIWLKEIDMDLPTWLVTHQSKQRA